jgi:hypothetical protein
MLADSAPYAQRLRGDMQTDEEIPPNPPFQRGGIWIPAGRHFRRERQVLPEPFEMGRAGLSPGSCKGLQSRAPVQPSPLYKRGGDLDPRGAGIFGEKGRFSLSLLRWEEPVSPLGRVKGCNLGHRSSHTPFTKGGLGGISSAIRGEGIKMRLISLWQGRSASIRWKQGTSS